MTNNQFCDLLSGCGCFITFMCFVACFFGAPAWIGCGLGILLSLVGMANYE